MLKNDIKHILRQKQTGFFCKHKKAALSTIKLFHVFLMNMNLCVDTHLYNKRAQSVLSESSLGSRDAC